MARSVHSRYRRPLFILIVLLSLFLLGTVIVLSSVTWFFGVRNWALLSERDVPYLPHENWAERVRGNSSFEEGGGWAYDPNWDGVVQGTESWERLEGIEPLEGERMPRIIHQTWMNEVLPEKWRLTYQQHIRALPDYTHFLWTDATARLFMQTHYPSFLPTYDSYEYNIQRADAIRYFVLHRYGGIYMDLDIGIIRDPTPLLLGDWDCVLAKTIPVGVSNDLMFSSKDSAFMQMVIHGLITFNHDYITNYPTVMFSTGPMFLSAQYSLYTSSHPVTPINPTLEIRVMPKSLYGKNALPSEAPHAFFSHFYGSSWHSDDSDFIIFLGQHGRALMRIGLLLVVVGLIRLAWSRGGHVARKSRSGLRGLVISLGGDVRGSAGQYGMLSLLQDDGDNEDGEGSEESTTVSSENGSEETEGETAIAGLSWVRRVAEGLYSPTYSHRTLDGDSASTTPGANGRLGGPSLPTTNPSSGRRRARSQAREGVLFFLPAFLTSPPPESASFTGSRSRAYSSGRLRSASSATLPVVPSPPSSPPPSKALGLALAGSSSEKGVERRLTPPPTYQRSETAPTVAVVKHDGEEWDAWSEGDADEVRKP